uniref:Interferon a3-like n=1 Tax=Paramormyrops kingsleyae TaxID=1676925 RepID=A0A3B3TEF2_9TELE
MSTFLSGTCFFIYFIFVFCSLQSVCFGCGWIQHRFRTVNSESLSLLKRMGGDYTTDTVPVRFPSKAYKLVLHSEKTDGKIAFLSDTINKIRDLFGENMDTVTWNKTALEHFKDVLHRQSHELHKCVSSNSKHEWKLERHFRMLHETVLKEMVREIILLYTGWGVPVTIYIALM